MNEKKKIVDMLANGKIDASQAEELLKAVSYKKKGFSSERETKNDI